MSDRRRVRLLVEGRVQGVGFRAFVAREAQARGIAGSVCNLPDGRVEVLAQGMPDDLTAFCEACRRGPASAHVTHIDIADGDGFAIEGDRFVIARDI